MLSNVNLNDSSIEFPLIDWASSTLNIESLNQFTICGVQHLSYTTAMMFKSLVDRGLNPENVFLIGKCYSSNPIAIEILRSLGIFVAETSFLFDSHSDFDSQFYVYLNDFISINLSKFQRKIIALDDGASLLRELTRIATSHEIVAVEQTSSGYHRAKKLGLPFPIINVARSDAKLKLESDFIARMISRKTNELINEIFISSHDLKLLILGGGPIGDKVFNFLSSQYNVDLIDDDPRKSLIVSGLKDIVHQYDVFIGCTGECSIPRSFYSLIKKNALLLSASSSDREFDSVFLREKLPKYIDCHKTIYSDGIWLANSGFPVNFDSNYLDSHELELTRSLLLLSISQASTIRTNKAGFINIKNENFLIRRYLSTFDVDKNWINHSKYEIEFSGILENLSANSIN